MKKLDPRLKDLLITLAAAITAYAISDVLPSLDLDPVLVGLGTVILTQVALWLTPMTRKYGIGSRNGIDSGNQVG